MKTIVSAQSTSFARYPTPLCPLPDALCPPHTGYLELARARIDHWTRQLGYEVTEAGAEERGQDHPAARRPPSSALEVRPSAPITPPLWGSRRAAGSSVGGIHITRLSTRSPATTCRVDAAIKTELAVA